MQQRVLSFRDLLADDVACLPPVHVEQPLRRRIHLPDRHLPGKLEYKLHPVFDMRRKPVHIVELHDTLQRCLLRLHHRGFLFQKSIFDGRLLDVHDPLLHTVLHVLPQRLVPDGGVRRDTGHHLHYLHHLFRLAVPVRPMHHFDQPPVHQLQERMQCPAVCDRGLHQDVGHAVCHVHQLVQCQSVSLGRVCRLHESHVPELRRQLRQLHGGHGIQLHHVPDRQAVAERTVSGQLPDVVLQQWRVLPALRRLVPQLRRPGQHTVRVVLCQQRPAAQRHLLAVVP